MKKSSQLFLILIFFFYSQSIAQTYVFRSNVVPNANNTWALGNNGNWWDSTYSRILWGYTLNLGKASTANGLLKFYRSASSIYGNLAAVDLSTYRTWNLPDASGVLATVDGGQYFTDAIWNATKIGILYGGTNNTAFTTGKFLKFDGTKIVSSNLDTTLVSSLGSMAYADSATYHGSESINTVGTLTNGSIAAGFTAIDTARTNAVSNVLSNNLFLSIAASGKAKFLTVDTSKYATTSQSGFLKFSDFVTFNNKVSSISAGNTFITIGGTTTTPTITSDTSKYATTSVSGFLKFSDFGTFNSKIGGTGTINTVPLFTANGTLGNSAITQSNGTNIGIGTTEPIGLLHLQAATGSNNMVFGTNNYPTTYRAKVLHEESYDGTFNGVPLAIEIENAGTYYKSAFFSHGQNATNPSLKTYYTTILAATSGSVGIGTIEPAGYKLNVNGNFTSGNITATGNTDIYSGTQTSGGLNVYSSRLTGWHITNNGLVDIRNLYVDELHAKAFIADLEMVQAGSVILTKSVSKIDSISFVVPTASTSSTLVVEEYSDFTGHIFITNDTVLIRTFSRNAGNSITIGSVWGSVTYLYRNASNNPPTQTYTFTRLGGIDSGNVSSGTIIPKGTLVLSFGQGAGGYIEQTVVDAAGSPYWRTISYSAVEKVAANTTTERLRLGNQGSNNFGLLGRDGQGKTVLRLDQNGFLAAGWTGDTTGFFKKIASGKYTGITTLGINRFYAGANDSLGTSAVFKVDSSGALTATAGTIGGLNITNHSINYGGDAWNDPNVPFYVDNTGNFSLKQSLVWDADANILTISGGGTFTGALVGGTILIGAGNNVFIADGNGIYLGNSTFSSAPFRVSMTGALTATNATITGAITASSGSITGAFSVANTLTVGTASVSGIIQSYDYIANTNGWKITKTTAEFNGATITGGTIRTTATPTTAGVIIDNTNNGEVRLYSNSSLAISLSVAGQYGRGIEVLDGTVFVNNLTVNGNSYSMIGTNTGELPTGESIFSGHFRLRSTGGLGAGYGLFSEAAHISTGGAGTLYAVYGLANSNGYGSSGTYIGVTGNAVGVGTSNTYGVYGIANYGTNVYGIYGSATNGTNNWAGLFQEGNVLIKNYLRVGGAADNTTAAYGIKFGSSEDTKLYRSAANTLKTDDALVVGSTITSGTITATGNTSKFIASGTTDYTLDLQTGADNRGVGIRYLQSNSNYYNWYAGVDAGLGDVNWSIYKSTAAGGTTFSTALFTITSSTTELKTNLNIATANGTHGELVQIKSASENLTLSTSSLTTISSIQIPAYAIVLAVTVRVTTTDTQLTYFNVYGNTSNTQFNTINNLSIALGTTDKGTKNCPYNNTTAQYVKIVADDISFTPGAIRITVFYYTINVPSS